MKKASAFLLFLLLSVVIALAGCSNENTPIENQTTNDFSQSSINTNEQSVDMENEEPRPTDGIDQLSDNTDEQSPNTEKEEFQPTEQIVEEQIAKDYNFTWIDEETASITIDGVQRTIYPFKSALPDETSNLAWEEGVYNFTFLSDADSQSTPWTFVKEGDTFLGWKITKIQSWYITCEDGTMYRSNSDIIDFECEVTVKGIIDHTWEATLNIGVRPDREYWYLFPDIIDRNNGVSFRLRNEQDGLEKELAYGIYEAELTIKNYSIFYYPTNWSDTADLVNIEILSIIELYDNNLIP